MENSLIGAASISNPVVGQVSFLFATEAAKAYCRHVSAILQMIKIGAKPTLVGDTFVI